jgi:hypothetical protein
MIHHRSGSGFRELNSASAGKSPAAGRLSLGSKRNGAKDCSLRRLSNLPTERILILGAYS